MFTAFKKSIPLYKRTLYIAVPVMVQNLITNFVALIDNIMVGRVGTEQMSGVAIVNQIIFVFNLAIFGAASGAGIFCAQFFGKKDYDGVKDTFRYKILTVSLISVIGIFIFLLFGDNLIAKFLHDADKGIDLEKTFICAKEYLLVMLIGLLPFSLEQAYSGTLKEGSYAVLPMISGICAVVTNTVLNYLLIFGIGPFPKLEVQGAAIATVVSRFVQFIIVFLWTHINSDKLVFAKGLYKTFKVPKDLAKRITKKGLIPLVANECLWGAGVATLTWCYSMRGIDVVASLNISNTVVNLFNVMYIAFGAGVSVVIGQMLGAGELEEAKKTAPKLIGFAGVMCILIALIMVIFSKIFPAIYNTTDSVKNLATMFIIMSAFFMAGHSMLHSTYFILRSGGKTLITFIFDSGFSWGIVVPVAFCLSYFTKLNVIYVYFICQSVEMLKFFLGIFLVKKGVWLSNIVSE